MTVRQYNQLRRSLPGGHSLVSVFIIFILFGYRSNINFSSYTDSLIICSFPTSRPAPFPLRSVRLAVQCQHRTPATTDLQFWLHDAQTLLEIPRQKHLWRHRGALVRVF